MSYCRFLEADVYVFMHVSGWLECCMCPLVREHQDEISFKAFDTDTMIAHLKKHVAAQHHVPLHVFDDLIADDKENFGEQIRP
jgi:phage replication-related protein YjqB (UPF0714/DUF867 family)